jgi:hypothetical protein
MHNPNHYNLLSCDTAPTAAYKILPLYWSKQSRIIVIHDQDADRSGLQLYGHLGAANSPNNATLGEQFEPSLSVSQSPHDGAKAAREIDVRTSNRITVLSLQVPTQSVVRDQVKRKAVAFARKEEGSRRTKAQCANQRHSVVKD